MVWALYARKCAHSIFGPLSHTNDKVDPCFSRALQVPWLHLIDFRSEMFQFFPLRLRHLDLSVRIPLNRPLLLKFKTLISSYHFYLASSLHSLPLPLPAHFPWLWFIYPHWFAWWDPAMILPLNHHFTSSLFDYHWLILWLPPKF